MPAWDYHVVTIPEGPEGIAATVAAMADFAAGPDGAQSPILRNQAVAIVAGIPPREYGAEVAAILQWVAANVPYRKDPAALERIQAPRVTLEARAGDCDDLAGLVAGLCGSLGHETRFVTGGMHPGAWSHVWVEVQIGTDWVPCDACDPHITQPGHGLGWCAPFPVITPWPINTPGGFDPGEALAAARSAGLAGLDSHMHHNRDDLPRLGTWDLDSRHYRDDIKRLGGWLDYSAWFKAPTFDKFSTDPALYPLPDPQAWYDFNDGNPPLSGETVPHWADANQLQRNAWLKAMQPILHKQNVDLTKTVETLDTVHRVVEDVATLGVAEVIRAWDNLVADANKYRAQRTEALARAGRIETAGRTADAKALRDAVAAADAKVREKLGLLEPWLKSEAGLGFLPTIIGGMAAPVALALIAAVAVAIALALKEVAAVLSAITEATGGMPWLFIVAAGAGYWYWKKQQKAGAGKSASAASVARNPAWRSPRIVRA